jgi:hypothetical protein
MSVYTHRNNLKEQGWWVGKGGFMWKMILVLVVWTIFVSVLGAITHERDIYRCLKKYGESRQAGWTVEIVAPNMKEKNQ